MYYSKVEISGVNTANLAVLDDDEKRELLLKARMGDMAAREELINGNLRLVLSVIKRFAGKKENADDLFQVGCVGLIKAVDRFNVEMDVKFSTYAVPKIAGEIRRFLRDDGAVKVSRTIKEQAATIKSVRSRLTTVLGREPSIQEISRQTGFSPEEIALAETATAATESIQRETGEEGFTLENILTDTESEEKMVERIALRQAIDKLPEREKQVIQLRYFHSLTQQRVAKVLDVSQVQVSRIEKKAIGRLRELMM
jgi:RNA polymerase sporulation-specific sigma factor